MANLSPLASWLPVAPERHKKIPTLPFFADPPPKVLAPAEALLPMSSEPPGA